MMTEPRKNLLFIFTDQQNRYALSCMDNPNVDTPNLDRLAAMGVLFQRFKCYQCYNGFYKDVCFYDEQDQEHPVAGVDGLSFSPLLRGETEVAGTAVFSERGKWCMIVSDGWKLAADRQDDGLAPTLMTHLDQDPYELNNRVEDPECSERRQSLLVRLRAWDCDVKNIA